MTRRKGKRRGTSGEDRGVNYALYSSGAPQLGGAAEAADSRYVIFNPSILRHDAPTLRTFHFSPQLNAIWNLMTFL